MHPMLNTAIKAARKAGTVIQRGARDLDRLTVTSKGPKDFVSEVDRGAEAAIVETLLEAYPDHGILAEEGTVNSKVKNPDNIWIIDPLDGTTNFLHGVPQFAISIAVEERKPGGGSEISHALVYQPLTDESFWAEKGRGAWLQDARLRVSARRDLSETVIGTGMPHCGRGDPARWAKIYAAVGREVSGVRRFGAASLDLAWVAAGRMDGFWEDDLDPWDTAAGVLLVREAGGFVTDYRGSDRSFERREYIAASASIHSKLQKLVAGALR
jgi:myo-inositol-1(or 4)-monophosphatase